MSTALGAVAPRPARRHGLVVGRVAAAGLAGVWMLLAARSLSLDAFADLVLVTAVAVITVQLADGGLSVRLPAAVAVHPGAERTLVLLGLRRRAVLALAGSAATAAAFLVAAQRPDARVAALFAVSVAATSLHSLLGSALRAMERFSPEGTIEPLARLAVLVLGVAALRTSTPLPWIAAAYAIVDVATLVAYSAVVRRATAGQPRHGATRIEPSRLLAVSVPLGTVYWRIDAWLLALMASGRQVARYGVAYRFLDAGLLPAMALSSTLPGRAARATADEVRGLTSQAIRQCTLSVVPLAVGSVLGGRWALGLLFGARYESAGPILAVLGVAALPSAAAVVLTSVLSVRDHVGYSVAVGAILVVSTVANLVAIPLAGAQGAAWTTLGSQSLFAAGMWWRLQHVTRGAGCPVGERATPVLDTAGPRTPLVPT